MNHLRIGCIKDLKTSRELWKALSPIECVYDTWEFRESLYNHDLFELFFYAAYDGEEPVALLPLQYNTDENYLEFFGGGYTEDNRILVKKGYESATVQLLKSLDRPATLFLMNECPNGSLYKCAIDEYKYFADISQCKTIDDYIAMAFRGKSKKNRIREMRILKESADIQIRPSTDGDMDLLVDLNISNLGNASDFADVDGKKLLRDLFNAQCGAVGLSVVVNGNVEGVTIAFFAGSTYTYFNAGVNKMTYANLGKYLIFANIEMAISLGAKTFDAGPEDLGWKEMFGLTKKPLFCVTIPQ
ncbi:GNAT family N-acetyltransferase [Candidatus Microgenomates bacterium]|nr:GNAT family N-acetyltransferase [Candidatus Microgenomates bacterium]